MVLQYERSQLTEAYNRINEQRIKTNAFHLCVCECECGCMYVHEYCVYHVIIDKITVINVLCVCVSLHFKRRLNELFCLSTIFRSLRGYLWFMFLLIPEHCIRNLTDLGFEQLFSIQSARQHVFQCYFTQFLVEQRMTIRVVFY